jgi:hypothetical protein
MTEKTDAAFIAEERDLECPACFEVCDSFREEALGRLEAANAKIKELEAQQIAAIDAQVIEYFKSKHFVPRAWWDELKAWASSFKPWDEIRGSDVVKLMQEIEERK